MKLLDCIKKYLPEIEQRMNLSDASEDIKKIESMIGTTVSDSFKSMYSKYNGENEFHTGIILGFRWMETSEIIEALKIYTEYELSIINSDTSIVPFAFDGSGCFFCVDMSPNENGTVGQVLAVDCDYDKTTKISDSLDDFFVFITKMLEDGKFYLDTEEPDEPFFDFDGGHVFDKLEEILQGYYNENNRQDNILEDDEQIDLPKGFWKKKFGGDKVSLKKLEKQKELMISQGKLKISLAPIAYMPQLQRLIIQDCTVTDFEVISCATELTELILVDCNFDYEKLVELCKLTKLRKLTLRMIPITNITFVSEIESLKILELLSMNKLDISQLVGLNKLQRLELEDMQVENFDFLADYKSLEVLLLKNIAVHNLEFLQYLKELKTFEFTGKADDETGLRFLKELPQLVEFKYPVSDMEWYVGCEKLSSIGIDAIDLKNVEKLINSNISNIIICNANNKLHASDTISMLKNILKINSYGMQGKYLSK